MLAGWLCVYRVRRQLHLVSDDRALGAVGIAFLQTNKKTDVQIHS